MKRYLNVSQIAWVLTVGGVAAVLCGGCGIFFNLDKGLAGNWGLETISPSGLPSTVLIYNTAGQVQQVVFRINGQDVSPAIISTSTKVNGKIVLVAVYMGTSTLLFGGVLDAAGTIATGTLTAVVDEGTLTVSIPNVAARMQVLLTD